MTKKFQTSKEDTELFRKSMAKIKPSLQDKFETPIPNERVHHEELMAVYLPEQVKEYIESTAFLSFKRPGVQLKTFASLKAGLLTIEATLDLHRETIASAKDKIIHFFQDALYQGHRVVHIIHGKGSRSIHQQPVLKTMLNTWLKEFSFVLAFCSAQPKHGSLGAVYILLKKH